MPKLENVAVPPRSKGVTTAATLWFVTVIGRCLGGGQIAGGDQRILTLLTDPAAGAWFSQQALTLAQNASPALLP